MTESNKKHPATRWYPPELRERAVRAVRAVHETIAAEDGQSFGVIAGSPASWAWGGPRGTSEQDPALTGDTIGGLHQGRPTAGRFTLEGGAG